MPWITRVLVRVHEDQLQGSNRMRGYFLPQGELWGSQSGKGSSVRGTKPLSTPTVSFGLPGSRSPFMKTKPTP